MAKQALNGTRKNVFMMSPDDLVIVGLDTDDGPEHPLYDERIKLPLDEALVLSIMYQGVLQAVAVRKDGDIPQVVYGRQRVRAAREASARLRAEGKDPVLVPVAATRGTDRDMFGVSISENEIRQGDSPMTKAGKLQKFMRLGASEDEAAVVFGVSKKTIQNWLRLLDCATEVQDAVESGAVSATAATRLASLPRAEQRQELTAMIESGESTTRHAAARARKKDAERKSKGEGGDEPKVRSLAPGKRTINAVIAALEQGEADVDPMVLKTLRWVCGDIQASSIKGLTKVINAIESAKEAPKAERKKKAPPR